jgi:hypothetical protein
LLAHLQNPSLAAVGLFARNEVAACFTLAWWAYNYCPGGWAARVVDFPPVSAACRVCLAVLRANTVVQVRSARVQATVRCTPLSIVSC